MYLSRVEVNKNLRNTIRLLAFPQVCHATVESSFPYKANGEARNLWRIDALGNSVFLLTLSTQKPDFSHIVEQFGWPASEQTWETKDYEPFLSGIKEGQQWRFRLRANPVHSVKRVADNDKARGQVLAHVTVEQQKRWLLERSQKHGFALDLAGFDVVNRNVHTFAKQKSKLTISIATFEGILTVEDSSTFCQVLSRGLGRAKAYGCGLMTLAIPK